MSPLLKDKTRGEGAGAALPVKSHFWIGRVHPHSAGVTEQWILNLKTQVVAEMSDKWVAVCQETPELTLHVFGEKITVLPKLCLQHCVNFIHTFFFPHLVLWSFICSAYMLSSVWYPGYQLFGRETAHAICLISIQHNETQFELWILRASRQTPDLEARWKKDIINSDSDGMYIFN